MEAFAAVADPARREIISALAQRDLSAGEVAALFPVSRPAVSRHLRVLREAGLVHDELVGRRRVYRLDVDGLAPVAAWLSRVTGGADQGGGASARSEAGAASGPIVAAGRTEVWSSRIDALETEVRRTRRQRKSASPSTQKETA